MLSLALDELIPIFQVLVERFDLEKFIHGDTEGKIDVKIVRAAHAAINTPDFVGFCEMVRSQGKILERCAHRLEGCECHRTLLITATSSKQKKRAFTSSTGFGHCYMQGRQAVWFQAVGLDQLLAEVEACSSDLLQEMLSNMTAEKRASLVRLQCEMSQCLVEELRDKFKFHKELPYSAIKIYWGEIQGGSLEVAQQAAREAIADYDRCIQAHLSARLHRVSHLLFAPGPCRFQLEQFAHGSEHLHFYPIAFSMVKRYALAPLVGRRVEAVHAEIKTIGAAAKNIEPPLISATLAEPIEHLRSSPAFHKSVFDIEIAGAFG